MHRGSSTSGSLSGEEGQRRFVEMRTDLGGCCVRSGYSQPMPHTFSRTEHIMSRYRPIAPKPVFVKPGESGGSVPSDPQSSSTLSFERSCVKGSSLSSDGSRGKRPRRRNGSHSPATRGSKRSSLLPNIRADRPRLVLSDGVAVTGVGGKATERNQFNNPVCVGSVGGPFGGIRASSILKGPPVANYFTEMAPTDTRPSFVLPEEPRFDRENCGLTFGEVGRSSRNDIDMDGNVCNVNSEAVYSRVGGVGDETSVPSALPVIERDPLDVEPPAPEISTLFGMSDEYTRSTGDLGAESNQLKNGNIDLYGTCASATAGSLIGYPGSVLSLDGACFNHGSITSSLAESEVSLGEGAESRRTNLVTLSLLPNTPLLERRSPEITDLEVAVPCLRLSMGVQPEGLETEGMKAGNEDIQKARLLSRLGLGPKEDRRLKCPLTDVRDTGGSLDRTCEISPSLPFDPLQKNPGTSGVVVEVKEKNELHAFDTSYLEQVYLSSPDPVMLTDVERNTLWYNLAYKRASSERSSGKDKEVGGLYIDRLGIPTQLSSFIYQTPQGSKVRAVLWGFLKKYFMLEASGVNFFPEEREEFQSMLMERKFIPISEEDVIDLRVSNQHTVIAPQPVRPIGSTLTVGEIRKLDAVSCPLTESLDRMKELLEDASRPAVITDDRYRVRYMNSAYKQMVGQPECPWLSTVGTKFVRENLQHSRLTGEVVLLCNANLYELDAMFLCSVLVHWINEGKEHSVTLSCEVRRLENNIQGPLFVWQLEIPISGQRSSGEVCVEGGIGL